MDNNNSIVIKWIEENYIQKEKVEDALKVSKYFPLQDEWKNFFERILLFCGVLSLATAIIFFIAYNWQDLGKLFKFSLVEFLIILSLFVYLKKGVVEKKHNLIGIASLFFNAVVIGIIYALFGQIYQTGADKYQLFLLWACSIVPIVVLSNHTLLWALWMLIVNIFIYLFTGIGLFFGEFLPIICNCILLSFWVFLNKFYKYSASIWLSRAIYLNGILYLTLQAILNINNKNQEYFLYSNFIIVFYFLWICLSVFYFIKFIFDSPILSMAIISFIVFTSACIFIHTIGELSGLFSLALWICVSSIAAFNSLKYLIREKLNADK